MVPMKPRGVAFMTTMRREDDTRSDEPLRLSFRDVRQVYVETADEDRFFTTAAEAARACQLAETSTDLATEFKAEFERILAYVHDWCTKRSDKVLQAYVAPSHYGLEVYLVTPGNAYHFEFDDDVTGVDLELVRVFPRWRIHVMQIPDETHDVLESFFSPSKALQVYGTREGAHPQG